MKTREILSIVALAALGLCLLCGLAKMTMKNENSKKTCDNACGILMFVALALIGVSQLIDETEKYKKPPFAHIPLASCKKFCNDDSDCAGDAHNPGTYCLNSPGEYTPGDNGLFCCFGSETRCSDWGKGCDCTCKNPACGFDSQHDGGVRCNPNTQEGRDRCALQQGGQSCVPTNWTYHNYAKGCCY